MDWLEEIDADKVLADFWDRAHKDIESHLVAEWGSSSPMNKDQYVSEFVYRPPNLAQDHPKAIHCTMLGIDKNTQQIDLNKEYNGIKTALRIRTEDLPGECT
jgi:hypothetical protein